MKKIKLDETGKIIDDQHRKAGLNKEILSKLVFENDESDQSSICGTVYLSKSRILVFQFKVWNEKPYVDMRIWFKDDDDNFRPTKKGIMIPNEHKEKSGTYHPFNDFCIALDAIRKLPLDPKTATESEVALLSLKEDENNNAMMEGLANRKNIT